MTSDRPFLLIMPSYNQSHYIAAAVDSVLAQDDPNWVLWIVDNSNDKTPRIMSRYTDKRIHFIHINERMDPGTCLNWVLEREAEKHRDFSYIHTDNILRYDYVRKMREALAEDEYCIAYCDMNSLDADGFYTGVFRRGQFDLARLFSFSSLGVPFSSTTKLSNVLGGFSLMDVADDVVFCIRAWSRARFVYIPDAIMDYRTHQDSRTTHHGGATEIERSFLEVYSRLLPEMEGIGQNPLAELTKKIDLIQNNIQLKINNLYFNLGPKVRNQNQIPSFESLASIGQLDLCGLQESPSQKGILKFGIKIEEKINRIRTKIRKRYLRLKSKIVKTNSDTSIRAIIDRRAVWEESTVFRSHAVPWVYLFAHRDSKSPIVRLASTDTYTLWATLMVHQMCGLRFQVEEPILRNLHDWPHLDLVDENSPTPTVLISLAPGRSNTRDSQNPEIQI